MSHQMGIMPTPSFAVKPRFNQVVSNVTHTSMGLSSASEGSLRTLLWDCLQPAKVPLTSSFDGAYNVRPASCHLPLLHYGFSGL